MKVPTVTLAAFLLTTTMTACKSRDLKSRVQDHENQDESVCFFEQNKSYPTGPGTPGMIDGDLWRVIDSLAEASLATYDDDATIKSSAPKWGYKNIDVITSGAMRAFIASNDKCVILAFRGTDMNSLRDWFVDARATSWT
jgi:hypothetical protein